VCLEGFDDVLGAFEHLSTRARWGAAAIVLAAAGTAVAQEAAPPANPGSTTSALRLPENPQLFGTTMPSVVKATAIVNGEIITQTDIDQRLTLQVISNGGQIPADEIDRLRQQILRNLIDETLQIQAAKAEEIEIKPAEVDRTLQRVAESNKRTVDDLARLLEANGASIKTMRRQIEGEMAWRRLQNAKIESTVSVGEDEVKSVLDRMNAAKGTQEFRVGEIFLSANSANQAEVLTNANRILDQLRNGASFVGYARQYSEASTAAVGGDLGWVRPEQLPDPIAAALRNMAPGQVSTPIPVQGGFSIVAVQDTRKVLTADARDAVLSLKQVSIAFPKGMTRQAAEPVISRFAQAARNVGGCGGADKIAADFRGEMVESDQVKIRDLPPALQEIMLPMQVGQATQPFGSIDEGVRVLVICGRDEVAATAPSYDEVYNRINEERANVRARRYLRDLRRDAIIEFR
jgi:peptidyl-prolyl cis-trans isomerase SurA